MNIQTYISDNESRFLEELFSLMRIPSVSSHPAHKNDMLLCAERWKELLLSSGADRAELLPTEGNPIVYAEKITAPALPTVLIYGHYDVMPAEPLEKWQSEPFAPVVRDGHVWGRGADDDKGQSLIQVKAFEYLVKENLLRHNVKFILEGEEEIGSPSLGKFLATHRERLACDVILVSDTSMLSLTLPSLTTGLRGLAYWQVEVTGPSRDLHSGHFGGAVANPINVLCRMMSAMQDADGRVTMPGFYDSVEPLSPTERDTLRHIPFDEEAYKRAIGVDELEGEKGYITIERNSSRPSFDICGIWGGYTSEGAKTVLPSKAYAKISCRLVPQQNHETISRLMTDYLQQLAPRSVKVKVTPMHGGESYLCPTDHPAYRAAERGFRQAFGVTPLAIRRGGSIPIISDFERELGVKTILMGFGLESNAIHSPNENMPLDMLRRGIAAVAAFHQEWDKEA